VVRDVPQELFEIFVERNIDISGLEVVKGERHGAVVTVTI
jgi:hypothetical protein